MAAQVVVVGSCNLDLIVEVPALPTSGQTMLGADVVSRPGGKGANQAVAAHKLGARTVFVAALGTDQFASALRAALADAGLDLDRLVTSEGVSGMALVVVDPAGENFITVASGANRRLAPEHVAGLSDAFAPASVLLIQLETPIATSLAAARIARAAGATIVLNAAPASTNDDRDLARLLQLTDVLIVNEVEALALCPRPHSSRPRPASIAEFETLADGLRSLGPAITIITLGEAGAVLADDAGTTAVSAHPVDAVDTTGAGDAFCGALAVAVSSGRTVIDGVRLGCLAGAAASTAIGAQAALPTSDDLARFGSVVAGG
jgi:ribokinase